MDAAARVIAYFEACNEASAVNVAALFTPDAVIYDTRTPSSTTPSCRPCAAPG